MDNAGSINDDILEHDDQFVDDEDKELVDVLYSSKSDLSEEPKDHYKIVYLLFYFYGITSLMPLTFFVTATDYWMYKFRDVTPHNDTILLGRTRFQADFISYMNLASATSSTLFLILHSFYGSRIPLKLRMVGSLIVITILFILTTIFVQINTDDWQTDFFIITMLIVFLINGAAAIFTGSLCGIVGKFPSEYMTAVISGQALGGIIAALAQILSLAFKVSPQLSALIYFLMADCLIIASLVIFFFLSRLCFFTFYAQRGSHSVATNRGREVPLRNILQNIWVYCLSILMTFAVTMAVYPSVSVLVVSQHAGAGTDWNNVYFTPVVNYLLFSCGDYCGRTMAGFLMRPISKAWVAAVGATLRIICIPLIMLCNAQPRFHLPVIMQSDWEFIIIMIVFSFSNGYLTNITFINAARSVEDSGKEKASSIMAAVLAIGISIGALLSVLCVRNL